MKRPRRKVEVTIPEGLAPATEALIQAFATAMAAKLRAAEEKYGYGTGWLTDNWREECQAHLYQHAAKGDPIDVAIYAAFLWKRGWPTVHDLDKEQLELLRRLSARLNPPRTPAR